MSEDTAAATTPAPPVQAPPAAKAPRVRKARTRRKRTASAKPPKALQAPEAGTQPVVAANLTSNPLRRFRAPMGFQRGDVTDGHFNTKRTDYLIPPSEAFAYFRDDFTYLPNPAIELEFKVILDDGEIANINTESRLISQGYNIAMAADFKLGMIAAVKWKKDMSGRLTFGGKSERAYVLYWAPAEVADAVERQSMDLSDRLDQQSRATEEVLSNLLRNSNMVGGKVRIERDV